jgi:hypothetical protein
MDMDYSLSMELFVHLLDDLYELEHLALYLDGWGWCRKKPSQKIIDILLERYTDESEVTKLIGEIVAIDTLDKLGEWGSCEERRAKMERWNMEYQQYMDLKNAGVCNGNAPRLLPLWVGDVKAAETRETIIAARKGW